MTISLVTALGSAGWEADMIATLERTPGLSVARRCVDVVELLSVAATGQARAALVSMELRRLDVDVVDRLRAAEVVPVGVVRRADTAAEQHLARLGVRHIIPSDALPDVIVAVVSAAVEDRADTADLHSFADPVAATGSVIAPTGAPSVVNPSARGAVIAVWGPTGAPGRTTVAIGLADEIARLGRTVLLIDADVYGGVAAAVLGLLDESPGLAAACRAAGASRLDAGALAGLAWQLGPGLRVLTGIPRAERWPELRASAIDPVLGAARELAEFTIVDCGFAIEEDEEISYDSVAPRRNGVTLAALAASDLVVVVGTADPIGMQRLIRALGDLRDAEIAATVWVVLNRVRPGAVPGRVADELGSALQRFAGRSPAALLPFDLDSLDSAVLTGRTLAEARPASRLRRALAELATAIAAHRPAGEEDVGIHSHPAVPP